MNPGTRLISAVLCCGLLAVAQAQTNYQRLKSFGFPEISGRLPNALIDGADGKFYGTSGGGGDHDYGTVFFLNKDGSGYVILHSFTGAAGDGQFPAAGLVEGSDGALYGTTLEGGSHDAGTVFRLNKDGSAYRILRSFGSGTGDGQTPFGALVEGSDGALYGTTGKGGRSSFFIGGGTVFKLNKDGSGYAVLRGFSGPFGDGSSPRGLIEGRDGALYGAAENHGNLGTGPGFGTVFKLNKDGGGFKVLHTFGGPDGDGANPVAGLVEGGDGMLYGTTENGGSYRHGTMFSLNKEGSSYSLLHSFTGVGDGSQPRSALLEGADGALYGTATQGGTVESGTVFKLSRDGSSFAVLHKFGHSSREGFRPVSLTKGSDDALYGTTAWGVPRGWDPGFGTVFKLNTDGTGFTTLHLFGGTSGLDGRSPYAALVEGTDGRLYGTAFYGGGADFGIVFKMNKDGSGYARLWDFGGQPAGEGQYPTAGLVEGSDGVLYGTTLYGGSTMYGTVFKLGKDGGGFRVLRIFTGTDEDGQAPHGGLVEGQDGALYGTTRFGKNFENGTVFKLNKDGSSYEVLHVFTGSSGSGDGASPSGTLVEGRDGVLYGTTSGGGNSGSGTVFKLSRDGSGYALLHHFTGVDEDGILPHGGLVEGQDGALYGTTSAGGSSNYGTVFKLNKDGSDYTVLRSFTGTGGDGGYPEANLVEGRDGTLYGTTRVGGFYAAGTVFKLNKGGSGYTMLHSFAGSDRGEDGGSPMAGLMVGSDGALYGTTRDGGRMNFGIVFKLFSSPPKVAVRGIRFRDTGAQLSFAGGAAGQTYNVQSITNLARTNGWQVIGSNAAEIDGRFQFLDSAASNYPARFYRSVTP